MKKNLKRSISYGLVLFLISVLALITTACPSTPTPTSPSGPTAFSVPPSVTLTVSPTASPSPTLNPSLTASPSQTVNSSAAPTSQGTLPVISSSSLPDGKVGTPYSQGLQATSGSGSYTWSISSSVLPTGLTLDSRTGTISGTPTAAATYFFGVLVTDSTGTSAHTAFSITIGLNPSATPAVTPEPVSTLTPTATASPAATPSTAAMSISTTSFPAGTVSKYYSQTLQVSGGNSPFIWSYWTGPLPGGLFLDAGTGLIFGTPTTAGTFNFTVQVTDSKGTSAARALAITINTQ